ncbi:hypothetical protein FP435_00195 (plasmid) [Lactobacillus sp. PV037]|uniref:hypothetical protein n=1 Tax=Lactobacillus sp. PV037 TaxID=2594496 RepID=UPI00224064D0|nr:hypothetical protein [Lactobacillus sp. PV037]QNQ82958.1 hypothetical protein FP435_00195 [Lactobacillus sp. PV037]
MKSKIEKIFVDPIKDMESTFLTKISIMSKIGAINTEVAPTLRFLIKENEGEDVYKYKGYISLNVMNLQINQIMSYKVLFFCGERYDNDIDFQVWKTYKKYCDPKNQFILNLVSTLINCGFKFLVITENKYRQSSDIKLDLLELEKQRKLL